MTSFISLILLVIGIAVIFIPKRFFKKLNTPMIGLLFAGVGSAYIFAQGLCEAIKTSIELVKGWLA